MGKKYGVVVKLNEELLSMIFSKSLLKNPSEGLVQTVKYLVLTNLEVPVEKWDNVECEMTRDIMTDTYTFRLRSFVEIDGLKEIRAEGIEYPKRYLKGFDD